MCDCASNVPAIGSRENILPTGRATEPGLALRQGDESIWQTCFVQAKFTSVQTSLNNLRNVREIYEELKKGSKLWEHNGRNGTTVARSFRRPDTI
jgi:hypothetical protein